MIRVPPADYSKEITGTRTEQRVKMNRMRQRIAQRLKEAQNVNAMLTTFNEIDMRCEALSMIKLQSFILILFFFVSKNATDRNSNAMEMRKTYGDAFTKAHGIKIGFMSAFVKAAAYALTEQPVINAVIDGTDIVYRDYVDISVAVATPKVLFLCYMVMKNRFGFCNFSFLLMLAGFGCTCFTQR